MYYKGEISVTCVHVYWTLSFFLKDAFVLLNSQFNSFFMSFYTFDIEAACLIIVLENQLYMK